MDTHQLRIEFWPFHYVPRHISVSDHVGIPDDLKAFHVENTMTELTPQHIFHEKIHSKTENKQNREEKKKKKKKTNGKHRQSK